MTAPEPPEGFDPDAFGDSEPDDLVDDSDPESPNADPEG